MDSVWSERGVETERGSGPFRLATQRWESQIRRALLIAHLAPAVFGLCAVLLASEKGHRLIDDITWSIVVMWCAFLLIAGWRRVGAGVNLERWIVLDSLIMAGLMFVGTSVRTVVHYVAIDGALHAAAFLSTRLGLIQLAIVFSGLLLGVIARALGSTIPTPLVGWVLPLVLPVLGVVAFGFLRRGLHHMRSTIRERDRALDERRRVAEEAAAHEATLSGIGAINESIGPTISEVGVLVETYASLTEDVPTAEAEVAWLRACIARATTDLHDLRQTLINNDDDENLAEAVETGLLGASVAHILALDIDCDVEEATDVRITGRASAAVAGFVREGVSNAVTHGVPPYRVIARRSRDDTFEVVVSERGRGPSHHQRAGSPGLGMASLAEYAAIVRGHIEHRRRSDGYSLVLIGRTGPLQSPSADLPGRGSV